MQGLEALSKFVTDGWYRVHLACPSIALNGVRLQASWCQSLQRSIALRRSMGHTTNKCRE